MHQRSSWLALKALLESENINSKCAALLRAVQAPQKQARYVGRVLRRSSESALRHCYACYAGDPGNLGN